MMARGFKPDPNDVIIVLMGQTGSGRTNFINNVTGNERQRKQSHLKSDTQDVTPYPITLNGRRVVLVDTPGFDDTYRPDTEILKIVADWLIQKYASGGTLRLSGIIYLHRITDNRMSGSAYKNLQMFGQMCGNVPLPRVHLVTTMWDIATDKSVAERREAELKREFWHQLLQGGATALRFDNRPNSAQAIIEPLLDTTRERVKLHLQEELEQQKRLNETAAAKVLYSRLQQLLAEQRRTLKELADQADARNDPALAKSLQEEYEKINAQLQKTFEGTEITRKVSFIKRIILWLLGRESRAHHDGINLSNTQA